MLWPSDASVGKWGLSGMGRSECYDITLKKLSCQISATVLMENFEVLRVCVWSTIDGCVPLDCGLIWKRLSVKVEGAAYEGDVALQDKELKRWWSVALNATGNSKHKKSRNLWLHEVAVLVHCLPSETLEVKSRIGVCNNSFVISWKLV